MIRQTDPTDRARVKAYIEAEKDAAINSTVARIEANVEPEIEAAIIKYSEKLEKLKMMTGRILKSGNNFDKRILAAEILQIAMRSGIIEAKSYLRLRQSRRDLRKLAETTITDVREMKIVLGALDESKDLFIKILMNRMKDRMIETLNTLKNAKGKYNIDIIGPSPGPAELKHQTNVTVDNIQLESRVIDKWTQSAKAFSATLDASPVEVLRMVKSIRTIFVYGLDNLKKAAEAFLAQERIF